MNQTMAVAAARLARSQQCGASVIGFRERFGNQITQQLAITVSIATHIVVAMETVTHGERQKK